MFPLASLLIAYVSAQGMSGSSARCTYHDYESYEPVANFENSPGWCGIRYSQLNLARITAVNGLGGDGCAKCLRVSGPAGSLYVLAIDTKADPGLDIARSSFAAITNENVLNPVSCSWTVVADSFCSGICTGTAAECTPGQRNLFPAPYLVEQFGARPRAPQGLNGQFVSGGGPGGNGTPDQTATTRTEGNNVSDNPPVTVTTSTYQSNAHSTGNAETQETGNQDKETKSQGSHSNNETYHRSHGSTTTSTESRKTSDNSSPSDVTGSRQEVIYGTSSSARKSAPLMFMLFILFL